MRRAGLDSLQADEAADAVVDGDEIASARLVTSVRWSAGRRRAVRTREPIAGRVLLAGHRPARRLEALLDTEHGEHDLAGGKGAGGVPVGRHFGASP